jgi:hypothetical protein
VFSGRSAFDEFLHSIIRDSETAAPLTVLSLLAQNKMDPWDEAARYARLPKAEAAMQLADLIEASGGDPTKDLGAESIAVRLVMLLPHASAVRSKSSRRPPRVRLFELFKQAAGNFSRNRRR